MLPVRIELLEALPHERLVGRPAHEIPTATQQQRLLQRALELVMALLGIAVLVGSSGLDRLSLETVVAQQRLVSLGEGRPCGPRRHGRGQPIGAVELRHAAQFSQRILQALAEALVALGKADGAGLPVRVGQHEVVDQMVEGGAVDSHAQVRAVGEVTGGHAPGMMDLGEEDLLACAVQGPPGLDASLQGTELAVGETARKAALQVGEQSLGLQPRIELKHRFELRPDLRERVRPSTPVAVHAFDLRGQCAETTIVACRLGTHAGLSSSQVLGQSEPIEATQPTNLMVLNHRKPS